MKPRHCKKKKIYAIYKLRANSVGNNKRAILLTQLEKNEQEAVPQGCSVTPLYSKYYPMSREISPHYKKAQPSVNHYRKWEEREK